MINIEIWASGGGTNADVILDYFKDSTDMRVITVGCNRREAGAFLVAEKHRTPAIYWSKEKWKKEEILAQLKERKIDFIVLAGFLKLVPEEVINKYRGRIINIHPSLLPHYGGQSMYGDNVHKAVLTNKESKTGITIHEVDEEFDKGKLIAQYSTALSASDEILDSIKQKIQALEHTNFAPTIAAWIRSKV